MKSAVSIMLLSLIQLHQSIILTTTPGCGDIPYCESYKPDICNMCNCSDPVNNPTLAMCTDAFCEVPETFIPECISCMDGYIFDANKNCVPRPITIVPIPPTLPPSISISPSITPCICIKAILLNPIYYAPVCCSDGHTYSNSCHARCNLIATECTAGECPTSIVPQPCDGYRCQICKFLPDYYYNYNYEVFQGYLCQGYPNAWCRSTRECSGTCYAVFVDDREYGNEIECIPPVYEPITCYTDANCGIGFYCRPDIKCIMAANVDPTVTCNNVCYNINGMCSVNTDCTAAGYHDLYHCIEGFCVQYRTIVPYMNKYDPIN